MIREPKAFSVPYLGRQTGHMHFYFEGVGDIRGQGVCCIFTGLHFGHELEIYTRSSLKAALQALLTFTSQFCPADFSAFACSRILIPISATPHISVSNLPPDGKPLSNLGSASIKS